MWWWSCAEDGPASSRRRRARASAVAQKVRPRDRADTAAEWLKYLSRASRRAVSPLPPAPVEPFRFRLYSLVVAVPAHLTDVCHDEQAQHEVFRQRGIGHGAHL